MAVEEIIRAEARSADGLKRGGMRLILVLLVLAICVGCMKRGGAGGSRPPDNSGPIQGIPWDSKATMPALTYDEGFSGSAYWARFVEKQQRLEIGRAAATTPTVTVPLDRQPDSFAWDSVTESYRLVFSGAHGSDYSVFNGLTPGNQRKEPYGLIALADTEGTNALYGLLGKAEPAPTSGVAHFNGGYLLSRRQGDSPVPVFTGKAQVRLDGGARPQSIALLLTVPPELPRLFGRRVGAIQLIASYDPASLSFRGERREVTIVGNGGRLRVLTFSLVGQVFNRGRSLAGLFRLYDGSGAALVVGGFSVQNTARAGPQTSQR